MLNLNLSIENKEEFQIYKISVVDNTYVKLHKRIWHVNASLLSKQIIWKKPDQFNSQVNQCLITMATPLYWANQLFDKSQISLTDKCINA